MATLGAKINHPSYGEGVIFNQDGDFWRVFFQEHGEKEFFVGLYNLGLKNKIRDLRTEIRIILFLTAKTV